MKIFLTGEGPTDCGCAVQNRAGWTWEPGPVQIYMTKIADDVNTEVEIITAGKSQIGEMRKTKRQVRALSGLQGHGVKAFFVAQAARDQGCDIAAMYVDADKPTGSAPKDAHACEAWYLTVREHVLAGLSRGNIGKYIAIVPMKMIECWILGDEDAFEKEYGKKPAAEYFRCPELIWGEKSDPKSDYPKNKLKRALAECGDEPSRDVFCRLAEASSLETMKGSCPISFLDFCLQCFNIFSNRKGECSS